MRPLETEYKDWRIVVTTRPVGRGWSALVEVWAPGQDPDKEGQLVPFNQISQNEKAGQEAGRLAAVRFIDRQAAPTPKPAQASKPAPTSKAAPATEPAGASDPARASKRAKTSRRA
jgi:hypothetical protein